jgi:hypothetical protein
MNYSSAISCKLNYKKKIKTTIYHPYKPMTIRTERNEKGNLNINISVTCNLGRLPLVYNVREPNSYQSWRKFGPWNVLIKCHISKAYYNNEDEFYNVSCICIAVSINSYVYWYIEDKKEREF